MKSMTGYGRAMVKSNGYEVTIEIRSVNHRYYEASMRIPRSYSYLEEKMKAKMQEKIARGKVEVGLTMQATAGKMLAVQVNHATVCAYLQALLEENHALEEVFGTSAESGGYLKQDITLSTLLRLPDIFQVQQVTEDAEAVWMIVEPVFAEALTQFLEMRAAEGERMRADILLHLSALEKITAKVEELAPLMVQQYYEKLYRKIKELLDDHTVDETRLVTEAAIVAEKVAVDEELARLRSHIVQFRLLAEQEEPVGRKLDFLVQEMNREVNTTGSKVQSLEITKLVVDMKAEIEKIREQIQNIE